MTSFGITFFSIPAIIKVCSIKKLFDSPNQRKNHRRPTPTLGGLGIFAGFVFSITFWSKSLQIAQLQHIICATLVIFFMGMKDDLIPMTPVKKIIGQLFAASIIILLADIRLKSLYGIFGVYEIAYLPSVILSLFTVLCITNSFNLIDGIDGLAASIGLLSTSIFGTWFYLSGYIHYAFLAYAFVGTLLAFLCFNKYPAKIFMGDTGSLLIGLTSSILAISFIELNRDYSGPSTYKITSVPAVAIGILIIPIFDTLQVTFRRILSGASPFKPDRRHMHYILSDFKLSHSKSSIILLSLNILIVMFSFTLSSGVSEVLAISSISIMTIFLLVLMRINKKAN
jgi:UDP-GlcNAc:undecaprenyl-phosphate/decaprenyl-phosphate GlcNAc-1-phosphate transferase